MLQSQFYFLIILKNDYCILQEKKDLGKVKVSILLAVQGVIHGILIKNFV